MRNLIGIFENHDFSSTMAKRHHENGHFIARCFSDPEQVLKDLNIGSVIRRRNDIRNGSRTRPLCNSPYWRLTSFFEFDESGFFGDSIVRTLNWKSKRPEGIKEVEKMLRLDDAIRFKQRSLPLIGNGTSLIRVPAKHGKESNAISSAISYHLDKVERDFTIGQWFAESGIKLRQLF